MLRYNSKILIGVVFKVIYGGCCLKDALEELAGIKSPGSVIVLGVTNEYDSETGKFMPQNTVLVGLTDREQPTNPKIIDIDEVHYRNFGKSGWENKSRYEFSVKSIDDDSGYPFLSYQHDAGFVVSNSGFAHLLSHFLPIKSPGHVLNPLNGTTVLDYLESQRPLVAGCMINNPVLKEPGEIAIVTPGRDDVYIESYGIPKIPGCGKLIVTPQSQGDGLFMVGEAPRNVDLDKPLNHLVWDLYDAINHRTNCINYAIGVVGLTQHPYSKEVSSVIMMDKSSAIPEYEQLDKVVGFS